MKIGVIAATEPKFQSIYPSCHYDIKVCDKTDRLKNSSIGMFFILVGAVVVVGAVIGAVVGAVVWTIVGVVVGAVVVVVTWLYPCLP